MRGRWHIGPLLIACALALALVPPAAGAASEPGWQPPSDISPAYLYTRPHVVPDANGGYLHSWSEYPSGATSGRLDVNVVAIPHAGPALSPQKLPGLTFMGVDLASNARGDAIVAWDEHSRDCCVTLSAALRKPGQPFGDPVAVPYGDGFVTQAHVAMNELGDSVIAYETSDGDNGHQIWAVFRPAGGDFGKPVPVSPLIYPANFQNFTVALTRASEAIVVWDPPMPTTLCDEEDCWYFDYPQVITATTGTSDGFGDPQVISDPDQNSYTPSLAANANGDAVVAWQTIPELDGSGARSVGAAVRRAGQPFGAPVTVADGLPYDPYADTGIDAAGHGLIAWVGAQASIATVDAGSGNVGQPHDLGESAGWSRVAVAPDGTALVALEEPFTAVAWGDSSGSFGPVRSLTCPLRYTLTDVVLADGGDGAVLVQDRGLQAGDRDDRSAIARSDTAVPASPLRCDQPLGGRGTGVQLPPVGPPGGEPPTVSVPPAPAQPSPSAESAGQPASLVPRISLKVAPTARFGRRGLPVRVQVNRPGSLEVLGALRTGRRLVRFSPVHAVVGAGITNLRLRSPGLGGKRPPLGRAGLVARIHTRDGHSASAHLKARIRLR